jgi:hypothetical protein
MNPYEETRKAAEAGIARADRGAADWRDFQDACVRQAAAAEPYLTMDEVRDVASAFISLTHPPFNLMAFGASMQRMQKAGIIRKVTDAQRPSRTRSQHRDRQVFVSLVYAPNAKVMDGAIQPPLMELDR